MQYSNHKRDYLRCDFCGQFVRYDNMHRELLTPDAEGTRETYETLCFNHYLEEKLGFKGKF